MHTAVYIAIGLLVSLAIALVAGPFCGFNDFRDEDDTDPARTQPEVARKPQG